MLSALRDATETTQVFWGCDENDVGGVLGVRIDGAQDFTGDTLAAADNYTGLVTATGLTAGTHTWQMLLDGVAVGSVYSFTTAPADGDDFVLLFIGDTNTAVDAAFEAIAERENPAAVLGTEFFYMDSGTNLYSDANNLNPSADNLVSYQNTLDGFGGAPGFRTLYRSFYANEPNRLVLARKSAHYQTHGNHDMGISDPIPTPGTVRYDAAHKALTEYSMNGHPVATGDIDSEPVPVLYFDKIIGDVHVIAVDMLTYAQPFANANMNQADGSVPTGAGDDKQVAWLKSTIQNSTKDIIVLALSTAPKGTEWTAVGTGLYAFLDGIDKTVFLCSGDIHLHFVYMRGTNSPTRKVMEIGYSASSGVTASKLALPAASDTVIMTDMWTTTLTQDALSTDTVLNVADPGVFIAGMRIGDSAGGRNTTINSVDTVAKTVTLAAGMGGATQLSGAVVRAINWTTSAQVGTEQENLAGYLRMTRKPNGDSIVSDAHTKLEIVSTYNGRVRWSCVVRDGEREPYFPRRAAPGVGVI